MTVSELIGDHFNFKYPPKNVHNPVSVVRNAFQVRGSPIQCQNCKKSGIILGNQKHKKNIHEEDLNKVGMQ